MGKRTGLYIACLILFPVAFVAFVVGFGCPVWIATSEINSGLWQICEKVFRRCDHLAFDEGADWKLGVRVVEVFALVMLFIAAVELIYENCGNFSGRRTIERLAAGILCVFGGLGGLAGAIVYAFKMEDIVENTAVPDTDYGWAFMLVAASSSLAFLLGIGFLASGCCLEKTDDPDKTPLNAYGNPYGPSSLGASDSYEMNAYTNPGLNSGEGPIGGRPYALYNGGVGLPRPSPSSLQGDPYYSRSPYPPELKAPQYYSYTGGDLPPEFDLSEGYQPLSRGRVPSENPYEGPYVARRDVYRREDSFPREGEPFSVTGGGVYPGAYPEASSRFTSSGRAGVGEGRGFEESFYRRY